MTRMRLTRCIAGASETDPPCGPPLPVTRSRFFSLAALTPGDGAFVWVLPGAGLQKTG